jgi:O-antigen/teichoic acid export membrane protein
LMKISMITGGNKKNYIITFATEFIVLVGGLLVYKLASNYFKESGFAEYALCRRSISFILPVIMLGIAVGLPRYISFLKKGVDKAKEGTYFISGLVILFGMYLFCFALMLLLRSGVSYLMFGDEKFRYLIFPIGVTLGGLILHGACYSFFRGRLQMVEANILQLINLGIVPVVVFFAAHDIPSVLMFCGLGNIIVSFIFLIYIFVTGLSFKRKYFKSCTRDLVIYGIQRVPGDIGIAAFFSIPAFLTSHIAGIQVAGYVAFGVSMLNMAGAVFGPICLIVLPEAGRIISEKDFTRLKEYSDKILKWTLILTMSGLIIFEIFAEFLINIYLGSNYRELIAISRVVLIGSLGYTVYISLRSILDAFFVKAVNTKNIFISFALFAMINGVAWFFNPDYWVIIYSFTASILLLGILTYVQVKKIFIKKGI